MSRNTKITSQYSDQFWTNEIEKSLEKTAVQPKRVDDSVFNQINSIMNNKSKYSSVEEAVIDMMQRSGYSDYKKVSSNDSSNRKSASTEPRLFETEIGNDIKNFIENKVKSSRGQFDVGAIIGDIKTVFGNQIIDKKLLDDPVLSIYINEANKAEMKDSPKDSVNLNMGKANYDDIDPGPENTDAFYGLNPAR